MIIRLWNHALRKIILVLSFMALIAGCAGLEGQNKSSAVPEILPGILAGYLDPDSLPNSLELLPSPPAKGSAAFALDKEVSRRSFTLRGTPRWELAIEDANLYFPEAAGVNASAEDKLK